MNNMFQMMTALRDPQAFISQIQNNSQMMQNPVLKNAIGLMQQGDTQGLQSLAENLCKERGTTPQDMRELIRKQLGM